MHNCKATREMLIAQALNRPDQSSLPAEVQTCATCREEYAALRNALRIVAQATPAALPGESFWPGYHTRLRQRLENAPTSPALETRSSLSTLLGSLFTRSLRVPVPLAATLLVVLGVSLAFALNSRRSQQTAPPIVVRTIGVPVTKEVIRERTVTRIVYREVNRRRPLPETKTIAGRSNESAKAAPFSLIGFKPTSEANLTVIKGSYRDEK